MLPLNKKLKLIAIGLWFSISLGVAVHVIFAKLPQTWDLAKNLDRFFYNIFFSSSEKAPDNLIIIDSEDPKEDRPRSEYATMSGQLNRAGAKCIAFDIRFLGTREHNSLGDQALVESVEDCSQVILAIDFASQEMPPEIELLKLRELALPASICQHFVIEYEIKGVGLPFPGLLSGTKHVGHINSIHNEYYRFPPLIRFRDKCYASLPLEIARLSSAHGHLGPLEAEVNGIDLESMDQSFDITEIPLDKDEQMFVNFVSPDKFRKFSWDEAMKLVEQRPESFSNMIVMIVNSGPEVLIPTPLGPYPRWGLMASITSQLLQNSYIEASPVFYPTVFSSIIIFIGLIWFLFVTPRLHRRWRRTRTLFLSGNVLFVFIIFILLRIGQNWIGVVVPLLMYNSSLLVVRKRYYTMIKPPKYLNFGLAVLKRQGENYPIQIFESPLGEDEVNAYFRSFIEDKHFQEVLLRINNLQAKKEEIKWIGEKLFSVLFQNDLFHALKNSWEFTKKEGKNLRLKLRLNAPELICLPWELMHSSKLPPGFIVLNKKLSLTRFIPLAQPPRKPKFRIPLRILVISSLPKDVQSLDVTDEIKLMKKALRPLIWGGDVQLRLCEHATLDKLSQQLEWQPDILHYIGHGKFDWKKKEGFLVFETESNESYMVSAEDLGTVLIDSSVKFVILNSCESAVSTQMDAFTGVAQNLVRVGVPAVLAMQFKDIFDDTSIWFSKNFYSTFIKNHSIDAAVAEARRYIMAKTGLEQQDWATPVLFMRAYGEKIFEFEL